MRKLKISSASFSDCERDCLLLTASLHPVYKVDFSIWETGHALQFRRHTPKNWNALRLFLDHPILSRLSRLFRNAELKLSLCSLFDREHTSLIHIKHCIKSTRKSIINSLMRFLSVADAEPDNDLSG